MKKIRNMKTICLTLAALALVLTFNIGNSLAYFTAHTSAAANVKINFDFADVTIEENEEHDQKSGWKRVVLTNTGTVDCYARMKAIAAEDVIYAGSQTDRTVKPNAKWTLKNGYYEYTKKLAPGESTAEIYVHFDFPLYAESYNVVIIQECTPVLHGEDGTPLSAKWDTAIDVESLNQ